MSTESQAVPSMEEADVLAVSEETEETMLSELTGDVSPEEDENVWGEERLTAVNALPDGSVTAEDGEAPLTEESVWTEEDEEGAIESQQIAEVLQGSRSSASNRAREMLEQGRSADEVARELHMGRNAIELIAQMVRRKQAATH